MDRWFALLPLVTRQSSWGVAANKPPTAFNPISWIVANYAHTVQLPTHISV